MPSTSKKMRSTRLHTALDGESNEHGMVQVDARSWPTIQGDLRRWFASEALRPMFQDSLTESKHKHGKERQGR